MTRRKFNLGEIIRKLNEHTPDSHPITDDNSAPNPLPQQPAKAPSPPQVPASGEMPSVLPPQPDFFHGTHRRSFTYAPSSSTIKTSGQPLDTTAPAHPSSAPDPSMAEQSKDNNASESASPPPKKVSYTPPTVQNADDEEEEEFDVFKYVGILFRRKHIILIVLFLSTLFALFRYLRSDSYYIATARLLFRPNDNQEILGPQRMYRFFDDREKLFNTHLELLKSMTVLSIVSDNLADSIKPEAIAPGLTIKQGETNGEKNDIIEMSFKHHRAQIAQDVLNELCRSYIDYRRDVNAQEVSRLVKKFEFQIDKIEKELTKRENDLRLFKEEHRMVALSSETNLIITKLSNMELALQQTQLSLLENKERLGALTTQIGHQEHDIIQSVTYHDPFKNRISAMELELNTLTTEYSPEHFKVKMLRQQIDNLKAATVDSITKEAESKTLIKNPIRQTLLQELVNATIEKSALDAKRAAQEQLIDKLNNELIKLPAMEQQFANLQRETESLLATLLRLKNEYEGAKIRRDSEESDLKILEPARTPTQPLSTTRPSNMVISILIGLILGIAIAFLIEYLDQSLKDPSSVEKVLGLPLLGIVPFIEADHALLEQAHDITKNLLEPFRALRANLKHIALTHNLQTFIICSAIKGEGKTTLGANLAITFALDGKKVILVDADLRRSQVHTLFGIQKQIGLSNYLLGEACCDEIIKPTRINNMSIVTSGERPNNPAELLGTPLFDRLVSELRAKADIIIFDSPALLPVSDTITMAPKMDGVLFMVRTFWTPLKAAKQALNQLERIGSKLYGGILNGASHSGKYYPYYYGYYGYYGYYSYKYSYEDDHKHPLSIRTIGLTLEKAMKSLLTDILFGFPKTINAFQNQTILLLRKKRFWFLLFLLLALTGTRVFMKMNTSRHSQQNIEYIGIGAATPPAPQGNDIAFTGFSSAATTGAVVDTSGLNGAVAEWFTAFAEKDSATYLSFYDQKSFRYTGGGFTQWQERTMQLFSAKATTPAITLIALKLLRREHSGCEVFIEFSITDSALVTVCSSAITWVKKGSGWNIINEVHLTGQPTGKKGDVAQ